MAFIQLLHCDVTLVSKACEAVLKREGGDRGMTTIDILSKVWSGAFGIPEIDPDADFFDLGGDSLIAMTISRKAAELGLTVSITSIVEYSSIRALAASLEAPPKAHL